MKHLSQPGYGKLQIGIYVATLDDAFRRLALDKGPVVPPDQPNNQGPGPMGGDDEGGSGSDGDGGPDFDEKRPTGRETKSKDSKPSKRRKTSYTTDTLELTDADAV